MNNEKIAQTLEQLADLMEFQGANAFRLRAYRNGARNIREMTDSISQMVADEEDLVKFEGLSLIHI